jgi:hypothetical protein
MYEISFWMVLFPALAVSFRVVACAVHMYMPPLNPLIPLAEKIGSFSIQEPVVSHSVVFD